MAAWLSWHLFYLNPLADQNINGQKPPAGFGDPSHEVMEKLWINLGCVFVGGLCFLDVVISFLEKICL